MDAVGNPFLAPKLTLEEKPLQQRNAESFPVVFRGSRRRKVDQFWGVLTRGDERGFTDRTENCNNSERGKVQKDSLLHTFHFRFSCTPKYWLYVHLEEVRSDLWKL